jgi:dihydrofolate synthase/folylpolyglutamate synthase
MKFGLENISRVCAALSHPERSFKSVLIGGTNGKGSVTAMVHHALIAADLLAARYTSPHLERLEERYVVGRDEIDTPRLAAAVARVRDVAEALQQAGALEAPPTFFECATAAAFELFREAGVEIAVLEVGLGGRLDATNVIDRPLVTAITPISYDHMQFLGDTLALIAGEKAGILKPGVPAAIGPQLAEAMQVIESRAALLEAPLHCHGRDWSVEPSAAGLVYDGRSGRLELPAPNLPGRHQLSNAGVALACLELMGPEFAPSQGQMATGLRHAEWPARLQRLTKGPLSELLPEDGELWLDGGHNQAAGEVLADMAKGWQDRPLYLVFGMLDTKEPRQFLRPLSPFVRSLVAVPVPGEHASLSTAAAAEHARAVGISASEAADAQAAVAEIVRQAKEPCRILICGSLYLAGSVLAQNG